jgi:hypothetical protein
MAEADDIELLREFATALRVDEPAAKGAAVSASTLTLIKGAWFFPIQSESKSSSAA